MRKWVAAALLMVGCGGESPPEFKDAKEERAYLDSLSNPTPSQWKRREALWEEQKRLDSYKTK